MWGKATEDDLVERDLPLKAVFHCNISLVEKNLEELGHEEFDFGIGLICTNCSNIFQ